MADGITPTEQDYRLARMGIELQLKACLGEQYDSLRSSLSGFVDNQVSCVAHDRATIRELYRVLNKDMN